MPVLTGRLAADGALVDVEIAWSRSGAASLRARQQFNRTFHRIRNTRCAGGDLQLVVYGAFGSHTERCDQHLAGRQFEALARLFEKLESLAIVQGQIHILPPIEIVVNNDRNSDFVATSESAGKFEINEEGLKDSNLRS